MECRVWFCFSKKADKLLSVGSRSAKPKSIASFILVSASYSASILFVVCKALILFVILSSKRHYLLKIEVLWELYWSYDREGAKSNIKENVIFRHE